MFHGSLCALSLLERILILVVALTAVSAAPAGDVNVDAATVASHPLTLTLVGGVSLLCLITTLAFCADYCQRRSTYKDYEDEAQAQQSDAAAVADFSMYPPVDSVPASGATRSPIVFEPLPDIEQLRNKSTGQPVNPWQLRPRVVQLKAADPSRQAANGSQQANGLHQLITDSKQQIARENLQYMKELGNGWFGKVLQGEGHNILPGHKKTKVVIQELREDASASEQLAFLQEAMPYRDVDSANVMRLIGQCVEAMPLLNILELCPFNDLKRYLRDHRVARESFDQKGLLLKFTTEMAAGLQALHEQGFVHRDFAARNCLLSSDLTVKVGDYGLGEQIHQDDYYYSSGSSVGVPVRWLAPEAVLFTADGQLGLKPATLEADVWSYGVALWEVLSFGGMPYSDLDNKQVLRLVLQEGSVHLQAPDVPVTHMEKFLQVMNLCLQRPPQSRPSLRTLRIPLLHLQSSTLLANQHSAPQELAAFDQKWQQLLPRKPAQIVQVHSPPGSDIPAVHNVPSGPNTRSAPIQTPGSLSDDIATIGSSPMNELSLAAELQDSHRIETARDGAGDNASKHNLLLSESLVSGDSIVILEGPGSFSEPLQKRLEITGAGHGEIKRSEEGKHRVATEAETAMFDTPIRSSSQSNNGNISEVVMTSSSGLLVDEQAMVTSTPKQSETNDSFEEAESPSLLYQTAFTSPTKNDGEELDDRSRFKAMLQTVVTSFDEDESFESKSPYEGSNFDTIFEEDMSVEHRHRDTPAPNSTNTNTMLESTDSTPQLSDTITMNMTDVTMETSRFVETSSELGRSASSSATAIGADKSTAESTISTAESTISTTESTISTAESTISTAESTISTAESTISTLGSTTIKAPLSTDTMLDSLEDNTTIKAENGIHTED